MFKFLGSLVNNDLTWEDNCDQKLKTASQRMYFLRSLKSFNVKQSILLNFYIYIIESVLTSSITVWFDKTTCLYKNKLSSIIRSCEKIVNCDLPSLESIYIERTQRRTSKIMQDEHHPSFKYFNFLPSNRRLRTFKGKKRFVNSFYPQAVKIFNNTRDK